MKNIQTSDFTAVKNDIYGNPRYVLHFLRLDDSYEQALNNSRPFGGKKFHNKQYGGGIVFQSYNLQDLCNKLNSIK
jgi:hypothetical protein